MDIRRKILFKILDKYEIYYDKDSYIDDDERAFDAIEEAMQYYADKYKSKSTTISSLSMKKFVESFFKKK